MPRLPRYVVASTGTLQATLRGSRWRRPPSGCRSRAAWARRIARASPVRHVTEPAVAGTPRRSPGRGASCGSSAPPICARRRARRWREARRAHEGLRIFFIAQVADLGRRHAPAEPARAAPAPTGRSRALARGGLEARQRPPPAAQRGRPAAASAARRVAADVAVQVGAGQHQDQGRGSGPRRLRSRRAERRACSAISRSAAAWAAAPARRRCRCGRGCQNPRPAGCGVPVAVVGRGRRRRNDADARRETGTPSCCASRIGSRARPGGLTALIDR